MEIVCSCARKIKKTFKPPTSHLPQIKILGVRLVPTVNLSSQFIPKFRTFTDSADILGGEGVQTPHRNIGKNCKNNLPPHTNRIVI